MGIQGERNRVGKNKDQTTKHRGKPQTGKSKTRKSKAGKSKYRVLFGAAGKKTEKENTPRVLDVFFHNLYVIPTTSTAFISKSS